MTPTIKSAQSRVRIVLAATVAVAALCLSGCAMSADKTAQDQALSAALLAQVDGLTHAEATQAKGSAASTLRVSVSVDNFDLSAEQLRDVLTTVSSAVREMSVSNVDITARNSGTDGLISLDGVAEKVAAPGRVSSGGSLGMRKDDLLSWSR